MPTLPTALGRGAMGLNAVWSFWAYLPKRY